MGLVCGLGFGVCGLVGGGDEGEDLVHEGAVAGGGGWVVVVHEREDEGLTGRGGEVAGERAGFAEGAGFSEDFALELGLVVVAEPSPQRPVCASNGESGFEVGEPELGGGVGEELGEGARGDEVVRAEAGAVVEDEVVGGDAGFDEKGADEAGAGGRRALRARDDAAEGVEEEFGVEVLADFVGIDDVF